MTDIAIEDTLRNVPSLRGLFVTAMPDCLLFLSWVRDKQSWTTEDVAAYFGDLVRSNRQGLHALGAWSEEMQVTIEAAETLLILRELGTDFVVGFVFERSAPLGMIRLHVKRVLDVLATHLPRVQPEERPRAIRITEFLLRYAPDSHMALQRVALLTGLDPARVQRPEDLNADEVAHLEAAACEILGLDTLNL